MFNCLPRDLLAHVQSHLSTTNLRSFRRVVLGDFGVRPEADWIRDRRSRQNFFAFADAVIEGDTIVVSSPEVPLPKYVRYGWAWNLLVNLYNKEGLPAITFRTDE